MGYTPRCFATIELKFRSKDERVSRYETQQWVAKFKVSGLTMTSGVRSVIQMSGFGSRLETLLKVVAGPKFGHRHNPPFNPRQMICLMCGKDTNQG